MRCSRDGGVRDDSSHPSKCASARGWLRLCAYRVSFSLNLTTELNSKTGQLHTPSCASEETGSEWSRLSAGNVFLPHKSLRRQTQSARSAQRLLPPNALALPLPACPRSQPLLQCCPPPTFLQRLGRPPAGLCLLALSLLLPAPCFRPPCASQPLPWLHPTGCPALGLSPGSLFCFVSPFLLVTHPTQAVSIGLLPPTPWFISSSDRKCSFASKRVHLTLPPSCFSLSFPSESGSVLSGITLLLRTEPERCLGLGPFLCAPHLTPQQGLLSLPPGPILNCLCTEQSISLAKGKARVRPRLNGSKPVPLTSLLCCFLESDFLS